MSQFFIIVPGGTPAIPTSFVTNNGTATPAANVLNVLGTAVVGSGVSTAGNIWITGSGNTVTVNESQAQFMTNRTAVNFAMSPYSATATDYYLSVDSSGGAISIILPNAPGSLRMFIVKDLTGNAGANNITVTGSGRTVDGGASNVINGNFEAANYLFFGTNYETY